MTALQQLTSALNQAAFNLKPDVLPSPEALEKLRKLSRLTTECLNNSFFQIEKEKGVLETLKKKCTYQLPLIMSLSALMLCVGTYVVTSEKQKKDNKDNNCPHCLSASWTYRVGLLLAAVGVAGIAFTVFSLADSGIAVGNHVARLGLWCRDNSETLINKLQEINPRNFEQSPLNSSSFSSSSSSSHSTL